MSTPQEQILAQRRVWSWFIHGTLPKDKFPRHFMSATDLEQVYEDAMKWRQHEAQRIAETRESIQSQ